MGEDRVTISYGAAFMAREGLRRMLARDDLSAGERTALLLALYELEHAMQAERERQTGPDAPPGCPSAQ